MNVITVGRSSENTVVVRDPLVSRVHLRIEEEFGRFFIRDLDSLNGTFVDGNRIRGEVEIGENAIVRIGETVLPWRQYFPPFNLFVNQKSSIDPDFELETMESENEEPQPQPDYIPISADTFCAPALKFRTNRNLAKYFFLSLLTLGIYGLVVMSNISEEINYVARKDGRHTMHYCFILFFFSWLTLGIVPLVWYHRLSNRIGNEIARRGLRYNFGASDYWLWNIMGRFIIVGPFIYIHKLMRAMNLLNADYNVKG